MIPYKWMDLTARDQTGVLLGTIHRKSSKTQNAVDIDLILFSVPSENGFLLTSWSIEASGFLNAAYPERAELNLLDAQGNTLSSMTQNLVAGVASNLVNPFSIHGSTTVTGSPIAAIGPGIRLQMRARFNAANAANKIEASINGVLIPRGTVAFQQ